MRLRRLSDLFWNISPNAFFFSIVLGVLTGMCYSLLVPFLIYAINADVDQEVSASHLAFSYFHSPSENLARVFLTACCAILIIKALSGAMSTYIANRASVEHRLWLYRRIQNMHLADLERIGEARLITILNIDIPAITNGAISLPQLWTSIVTVLGVLAYLLHLNAKVFVFVIACLVLAVLTYQLPLLFATRFLKQARDSYDKVQQGVTGLIYGAKELTLNRHKSDAYFEHDLRAAEMKALRDGFRGSLVFIFAQNYGEILSLLLVSVVVFHLRYVFMLTFAELVGLSMALLYLTGPISIILNVMNNIRHGKVSLLKLQAFYDDLEDDKVKQPRQVMPGWTRLAVRDLYYSYKGDIGDCAVQGVSLEFFGGDITFIVGGNGCGKSTLGKCLSLHYVPLQGQVLFGDEIVTSENIESGRQCISAIFPDYYLFKKLYSRPGHGAVGDIANYLRYLELHDKVTVVGDEFASTDLSEGQRKRLALLVMLLENRKVCIFDEWAADQDPKFKEVFYSVILPDLKKAGKIVIVISHDDRYFGHADKVITMENGKVVNVIAKVATKVAAKVAAKVAGGAGSGENAAAMRSAAS